MVLLLPISPLRCTNTGLVRNHEKSSLTCVSETEPFEALLSQSFRILNEDIGRLDIPLQVHLVKQSIASRQE